MKKQTTKKQWRVRTQMRAGCLDRCGCKWEACRKTKSKSACEDELWDDVGCRYLFSN